jgi:hypothetical protein
VASIIPHRTAHIPYRRCLRLSLFLAHRGIPNYSTRPSIHPDVLRPAAKSHDLLQHADCPAAA